MKKIGAITVVRNAAKYIIPHLRMYTGVERNVVLFMELPLDNWKQHYPEDPDNTLELIAKHCPGVEVFRSRHTRYDGELMNQMLDIMNDCDVVVHLHADVIMNQDNWVKLRTHLEQGDSDVYLLDMPKCHIDYYYDFDHGLRDCLDIEPIVSKPTVRYTSFYDFKGTSEVIDWLETHHFNGWKGIMATEEWRQNKVPTESNVYFSQMEAMGWTPCPEDIRELFKI